MDTFRFIGSSPHIIENLAIIASYKRKVFMVSQNHTMVIGSMRMLGCHKKKSPAQHLLHFKVGTLTIKKNRGCL